MESNDSPEIPNRRETSDIPGLPSGTGHRYSSRKDAQKPHIILLPKLVWLCSIMSQIFMQKNWFSVFNVKLTMMAFVITI